MPYDLAPEFHDRMVAWASAPVPAIARGLGAMESQYAPEIGRAILGRIWLGETVAQIAADPAMPCVDAIYAWRRAHEDFRADWDAMQGLRAELGRTARTAAAELRRRTRHPGGRPSTYTPEMAAAVCALIEDGRSMSEIVRTPGLPSLKAVYGWLRSRPEFAAAYTRACVARAERLADEAADVAAESSPMTFERDRARVARIEGRIGRLAPRVYRPPVLGRGG